MHTYNFGWIYSLHGLLALTLLLLISASPSVSAAAQNDHLLMRFIEVAENKLLHQDPQWLALLHYRPSLTGGWSSEADNPSFFLAPNGKNSPRAELIALIRAIINPPDSISKSAFCRFPARSHWILSHFTGSNITIPHCEELDRWKTQFSTDRISIVFASAYMGNPASMFGHTFLRFIDDNNDKINSLSSLTLSYMANSESSRSPIDYIAKGLTGGFPGVVSEQPYFIYLRRYLEDEGRDLWEYYLDFSSQEIELVILHAWEVRADYFDYYFLDENCGYRIISILAAAKPELAYDRKLKYLTIPADTIRILADKGLITHVDYRPSSVKLFNHHASHLSEKEKNIVLQLINSQSKEISSEFNSLDDRRKDAVLSLAAEYTGLMIGRKEIDSTEGEKLIHEFIKSRSFIQERFTPKEYTTHPTNPIHGHRSSRLQLAAGNISDEDYMEIGWRMAGHDFLDPINSHEPGVTAEFFAANYRLYKSRGELEKIDFLRIASYPPITQFFRPKSWEFNISRERKPLGEGRTLLTTVSAAAGYSFSLKNHILSGLLEFGLDYDGRLGGGLEPKIETGISFLGQFPGLSYQIGYAYEEYPDNEFDPRRSFALDFQKQINTNNGVRTTFSRTKSGDYGERDFTFRYFLYF